MPHRQAGVRRDARGLAVTEADWARFAPQLDAALAHAGRTHTLADVRAMVEAGQAQAWVGPRAAVITVIEDDPGERRLLIWLAGGELSDATERLLPRIEAWASEQGCRRSMIIGRPGWERVLATRGYAPLARIIAKEL